MPTFTNTFPPARSPIRLAMAAALLLAAGPALLGGQDPPAAPAGAPPAAPAGAAAPADDEAVQRVIVRVDRRRDVPGTVAFEDAEMLFVRRGDGQLERFIKRDVLGIVHLVDPEPGQTGTVHLYNGQRRRGVIIEDRFDGVVLEIAGVRTTLRRDVVGGVTLDPTFDEQYQTRRADLHPDLPERHLDLCTWLVATKHHDLAARELKTLLEQHDLPEARRLLAITTAQLALREGRDVEPPAGEKAAAADPRGIPTGPDGLPLPLLTDHDVNLIRVFEIDFRRPPKVDVSPAVIRELLETYATSALIPDESTRRTALFRADPIDIVQLMFALRARELYPRIKMLSEPQALNLFRQRVHDAWLMNSCATSRCHGGPEPGRFFLHRRSYKDPRVRYTNLLILERLELDPDWPLIDYESPLDSLIIQYGLPRTIARKPHPEARGWNPVFRQRDDRMIRSTVRWLDAMMKPRIDYPVEYEPPALEPLRAAEEAPAPRRER